MFNKFLTNKKRLFIITLGVLGLISIIWIFSVSNKPKTEPSPTPNPIKFELKKTIPENNSNNYFPATTAIEFSFTKPLNVKSLVINTKPQTDIVFETDQNDQTLYIRALKGWKFNTNYQISINVDSKNGELLPQKIDFNFQVTLPKSSQLDEVPR